MPDTAWLRLRNDELVAHAAFSLSEIRAGKLKKAPSFAPSAGPWPGVLFGRRPQVAAHGLRPLPGPGKAKALLNHVALFTQAHFQGLFRGPSAWTGQADCHPLGLTLADRSSLKGSLCERIAQVSFDP